MSDSFMYGTECYICHEVNPHGRYQPHEGKGYFCGKHTAIEIDDWQSQPAISSEPAAPQQEPKELSVCANCGKPYREHLLHDGNKCSLGSIMGWFPQQIAAAIMSRAPSKELLSPERLAEINANIPYVYSLELHNHIAALTQQRDAAREDSKRLVDIAKSILNAVDSDTDISAMTLFELVPEFRAAIDAAIAGRKEEHDAD